MPLHVPEAGVWIVKRRGDGAVSCLDDRCTHLGCRFSWNAERKVFECPCHGSEFDIEGNVNRGPASRPLQRLSTADPENGKIRLIEKGSGGSG
ncbi:MAG: Rieske 2Fe-2S domain-containing protein [Desulfomonile tiedjei]|nr:Rieske 2Fe-2S domain-containing protein [Desulfomonile tiedjei]